MRTNAVYIRRRQNQQSHTISPLCPHDVTFCSKESVPCHDANNQTAFRRAVSNGDVVERRPDPWREHNGHQQPVHQGQRIEKGQPEMMETTEVHSEIYPVRPTRVILQEIINFFSTKVTPRPPRLPRDTPLPLAQSKIPSSNEIQKTLLPHHESKSADKENIPPHDPDFPTAVAMLQDLRQKASVKQQLIRCPPPPRVARRLAPRNFGEELSPGALHEENSVIKKPDEGARVRRSIAGDRVQRKLKKCGSRSSSSKHKENIVENGTPVINEKKNTIIRRSLREENTSGTVLVSRKHLNCFFQLVEDPLVAKFLKVDICRRYADKYLLAMVFTYFVRAGLKCHQYSKENFFAALYLAHDMEEDEEELKYEVFPWALGQRWRKTYPSLLRMRDDIFWSIDCRAVVSKKCCDQVMEMQPEHWLWERERPSYHGGALREHLKHPNDNGHPRGPDKSPLRCQTCFERECSNSENSYLLYLSESDTSTDSLCMDGGKTVMHRKRDSGFETFLCERSDTSMNSQPQDSTKHNKFAIAVDMLDADGQLISKANSFNNCCNEEKYEKDIAGFNSLSCDVSGRDGGMGLFKNELSEAQEMVSSQSDTIFTSQILSTSIQI